MKPYLLFLVCIALSACRQAEELMFLESGNISAVSHGDQQFKNLLIGAPDNPYSGNPVIYFKLPDGSEFHIGSKLEGELLRLCNKIERIDASTKVAMGPYPGRKPKSERPGWGEGAEWIPLLGVYVASQQIDIVVKGEEIIGVSIYCKESKLEKPIEVRTKESSWYTFPLKKSSLEALFGDFKASYRWNVH